MFKAMVSKLRPAGKNWPADSQNPETSEICPPRSPQQPCPGLTASTVLRPLLTCWTFPGSLTGHRTLVRLAGPCLAVLQGSHLLQDLLGLSWVSGLWQGLLGLALSEQLIQMHCWVLAQSCELPGLTQQSHGPLDLRTTWKA